MEPDGLQNPEFLGSTSTHNSVAEAQQLRSALRETIDWWGAPRGDEAFSRVLDLTYQQAYEFALMIFPNNSVAERAVERAYDVTFQVLLRRDTELYLFWPCMEAVVSAVATKAYHEALRRRRRQRLIVIFPFDTSLMAHLDQGNDVTIWTLADLPATLHHVVANARVEEERIISDVVDVLQCSPRTAGGSIRARVDHQPCDLAVWFRGGTRRIDARNPEGEKQNAHSPTTPTDLLDLVLGLASPFTTPAAQSDVPSQLRPIPPHTRGNGWSAFAADPTPPPTEVEAAKQRLVRRFREYIFHERGFSVVDHCSWNTRETRSL